MRALLRERPLIVMECSVIAERYLGLGYSEDCCLSDVARLNDLRAGKIKTHTLDDVERDLGLAD